MKASEVKNYFNYDESNSSNPLVLKRDLCTHNKKGKRVGYNHNGYQRASLNGRKIMVHQLVWAWHTGEYTGDMVIDHIDHDRSNNLISNLRKVSQADNCRNAKLNKTNSSGLHGVSFNKGKCDNFLSLKIKILRLGFFRNVSINLISIEFLCFISTTLFIIFVQFQNIQAKKK